MMTDEPSIVYEPWDESVDAREGESLLDAAERADVGIESLCGGEGLCGTCTVVVESGQACLSAPTDADERLLSESQLDRGYRLSCRADIASNCAADELRVRVPSVSRETGGIVLTEGREIDVDLDPAVKHYHLELSVPTLEDNLADRERLLAGLETAYDIRPETIDYRLLRALPNRLREGERDDTDDDRDAFLEVTATVYADQELIDVRAGVHEDRYGLAVDIGTTTIAVYLVDLQTGEVEAVSSRLNPQTTYGGDVMSRVRHSRNEPDGLTTLQESIVDGVNECIDSVTLEADVDPEDVYEAVFVGNTAMHHLFLGIEPSYVAGSPYVGANHAPIVVKAREVGIEINPAGYLSWLPISGGWVGPDKVSVVLVAGHYRDPETTVCIDIGTNGEISVGNDEALWTTSAPAGPALEGAEITHGLRAQEGAIEHVRIDPESFAPEWEVIGDAPPAGICGSGVIDAVAQLFEVGVLDRRGKFREAVLGSDRVRRNEHGVLEFVLVEADAAAIDSDVVLTQNDVREIQMAKAAIQAGTLVLLDELDIETVDRVVLAGGFGNYIDPESARTIGLYPDTPIEAVESLGNAAGIGAKLALLDRDAREEAERIVDRTEYFEIAGTDAFRDSFMASMYLPHRDLDRYPRVTARIEAERGIDDLPYG